MNLSFATLSGGVQRTFEDLRSLGLSAIPPRAKQCWPSILRNSVILATATPDLLKRGHRDKDHGGVMNINTNGVRAPGLAVRQRCFMRLRCG